MESDQPPPPLTAPATVAQEEQTSLRSAGQRRINAIWEYTQAFIAGTTVSTVLYVAARLATVETDGHVPGQQVAAFVFLTGVANLVIGFYFGRTNHQRTGGVGGQRVDEGR